MASIGVKGSKGGTRTSWNSLEGCHELWVEGREEGTHLSVREVTEQFIKRKAYRQKEGNKSNRLETIALDWEAAVGKERQQSVR